jgi:type IV pilus assembly protein PilA
VDKNAERDEAGYSLIELLVVIIIVGILAGIAIAIFMKQSNKASDASTRSDLRNLAVMQEGYLTDNPGAYGTATQLAGVENISVSPQSVVYVYTKGSTGYCLVGHTGNSTSYLVYDSQRGGVQGSLFATLGAAQATCTSVGYTAAGSFARDATGLHVS